MDTKIINFEGVKKWSCCLCNNWFSGEGNKPYPLSTKDIDLCCHKCNDKVITARMNEIANAKN